MDNWRVNHLMSLLKEDPKDEFVLYAIAQEYVKLEQPEEALVYFLRLKETNNEYIGLYYHLAALYTDLDEPVKAKETYDEGITIAKSLGDHHALSELMNARTNFELGI